MRLPVKSIVTEDNKEALKKLFWNSVKEKDPEKCWHWRGKKRNHYPRMYWSGSSTTVHRVTFELFYGIPPQDKPYILHSCDNKSCVNPNHLRCGTSRHNAIDMRFNKKPLSLSDRDIKVVKFMKSLNYTCQEISEKFNVDKDLIRLAHLDLGAYGDFPSSYDPRRKEQTAIITNPN